MKHIFPEPQCLGFLSSHLHSLTIGLVPLPKQVQHPVYNNATQLLFERHLVLFCILPYSFETDDNITRNEIPRHIVKRNNIGIRIVIQVLLIHTQKVLIVTEEVINISY